MKQAALKGYLDSLLTEELLLYLIFFLQGPDDGNCNSHGSLCFAGLPGPLPVMAQCSHGGVLSKNTHQCWRRAAG